MIRRVLLFAAVAALPLAAAAPALATTAPLPGPVRAFTATPGPAAGQMTFSWKQDRSHTTGYRIETGLTAFSPFSPGLPLHGRHPHYFYVKPGRSSVTLTAAQMAAAGTPVAAANHFFYRFQARNQTAGGLAVREWPYLQSAAVKRPAAPTSGTALRVASFNVRSSMAGSGSARPWLQRLPGVARTILSRNPGVVTLQELGSGRADGEPGSTVGHARQTTSLVSALRAQGGGRYRLVRTTRYSADGVVPGIQGARILYDSSRYRLVSRCPDTTAGRTYSSACAFVTPYLAGEAPLRRWAAYARLEDRATGKRVFVTSVHLDPRRSTSWASRLRYERLRTEQMRAVIARVNRLNANHLPVVLAGDLNGGQNCSGGPGGHDALIAGGYFDTAAAQTQVLFRTSTYNGFARTIKPSAGWGCRLDVIGVKGIGAATRFENVMRLTDANRASDHNMVLADFRLP